MLIGNRKFILGMSYLIGCFVIIETALAFNADAGVIASVAGGCISIATGLGAVVYANVLEHRAKSGTAQ